MEPTCETFHGDEMGTNPARGHQCWIGDTQRALTSTSKREPKVAELIEARALHHIGHEGLKTPGGVRNNLSREHPAPDFHHFATDAEGQRLITDAGPRDGGGALWLDTLPQDETSGIGNWTYLLNPRSSWQKGSHIHPFLSPDGKTAFFNSDESGVLQCYMLRY